ncbi:adenylate cyclase associated N terminal-domain-containing protein [Jimgerdemannia flammicorona]|uniref:Adenylate cyclase associated N terminal-domain-containing protein n=1 Tax=Jimgerdemannia flammicorona TaxID=994334 RepID=A0A433CZH9_9FUNG|nr:adenylate cyclase associated N terminal-domain-containing protein [Jimgerdemannia flammicorona]
MYLQGSSPAPYIQKMISAAEVYANKVKMEFEDKDPIHCEWVDSYMYLLQQVHHYVEEYHAAGITWNLTGDTPENFADANRSSVTSAKPVSSSSTTSVGGGSSIPSPPPPPPGPSPTLDESTVKHASVAGDMKAVFRSLNIGESVTAGLKKVDQSQMTHMNPGLRGSNMVKDIGYYPTPTGPTQSSFNKPARTALEGNKWIVENYSDNQSIVISDTSIDQTVYIYGCKNSTIQVKGKVNVVTMGRLSTSRAVELFFLGDSDVAEA